MQHEKIALQAGPVQVSLVNGELRYLRVNGIEAVRRVYVAVRDRHWNTVPAIIASLQVQTGANTFRVSFSALHQEDETDFFWQGKIVGEANGTITFTMEGEAQNNFWRNRIGICVLHPLPECAGQACRVEHSDGSIEDGVFPQFITPQQPFKDIRAITHEILPGLQAEIRLAGAVFEIEDHRNWTDGSYKIYSTPLALLFPVELKKGEQVLQSLTFTLHGNVPAESNEHVAAITINFDRNAVTKLPNIGLGMASHGQATSQRELQYLRELNLTHLRVELKLQQANYTEALACATNEANKLSTKLEVALFLSNNAEQELRALQRVMKEINPPIIRWLIFHIAEPVTSEKWVAMAREILTNHESQIQFGAGTNNYFAELNRNRPSVNVTDTICYSINPQVHATDNDTLIESLAAQAATVESVRQFIGNASLAISPITLKPRFNPHATNQNAVQHFDELPASVDVRQMSLFAAAWTLGSLKYLSESGTENLTYFETTGWRGVLETEQASHPRERFASVLGSVFPLWHVLADVGEFAGGEILRSRASEPLKIISLVLRHAGKIRLLLANFSNEPQTALLEAHIEAAQITRINAINMRTATAHPLDFRVQAVEHITPTDGTLELNLSAEELVRLDFGAG